jgi:hypothetical protein
MICFVTEKRFVEMNAAAQQRVEHASKNGLCVACLQPLDGDRPIRGCHVRCHRATLRAIERGDTTELSRVLEGKFLTKHKGGRKPSNPVTKDVSF